MCLSPLTLLRMIWVKILVDKDRDGYQSLTVLLRLDFYSWAFPPPETPHVDPVQLIDKRPCDEEFIKGFSQLLCFKASQLMFLEKKGTLRFREYHYPEDLKKMVHWANASNCFVFSKLLLNAPHPLPVPSFGGRYVPI